MSLRHNKLLKLLSILLFTFGLVAPIVGADTIVEESELPGQRTVLPQETHHGALTQLLFEENSGEEERDARDDKHQTVVLFLLPDVQLLSTLVPQTEGYSTSPIQKLGTHPPLFRLHRTFLL
jgi:hypothetical protein